MKRKGGTTTPDQATLAADAEARYLKAVEYVEELRLEWESRGKPLTDTNPNGIEYEHPIPKMLRQAVLDAAKLAKDLQPAKAPGRPAVATAKPIAITESPAVRRRRMHVAS